MAKKTIEPDAKPFRVAYKVLVRCARTGKINRESSCFDCQATSGLTAIDRCKSHLKALFGVNLLPDDGTHDDELKAQGDVPFVGRKNTFKVL